MASFALPAIPVLDIAAESSKKLTSTDCVWTALVGGVVGGAAAEPEGGVVACSSTLACAGGVAVGGVAVGGVAVGGVEVDDAGGTEVVGGLDAATTGGGTASAHGTIRLERGRHFVSRSVCNLAFSSLQLPIPQDSMALYMSFLMARPDRPLCICSVHGFKEGLLAQHMSLCGLRNRRLARNHALKDLPDEEIGGGTVAAVDGGVAGGSSAGAGGVEVTGAGGG